MYARSCVITQRDSENIEKHTMEANTKHNTRNFIKVERNAENSK